MLERFYPERVCFCVNYDLGVKLLVSLLMLLRLAGLVCGVFYGPYFYLVICITGLLLSGKEIQDINLFCTLRYILEVIMDEGKSLYVSDQYVKSFIYSLVSNLFLVSQLIIFWKWPQWLGVGICQRACFNWQHFSGDIILLFSLFKKTNEGKPSCDFTNQKVWIWIWEVLNIFAVVGLIIALGKEYILQSLQSSNTF